MTEALARRAAAEGRPQGRTCPATTARASTPARACYVYANNGEHGSAARTDPTVPSGVLAEWDGKADTLDHRAPQPVHRSHRPRRHLRQSKPRHRSDLDRRLGSPLAHPHAARRRQVASPSACPKAPTPTTAPTAGTPNGRASATSAKSDLLMTMHGTFWHFPENLLRRQTPPASPRARTTSRSSATSAAGTTASSSAATTPRRASSSTSARPRATSPRPQSQSNLWFVEPATPRPARPRHRPRRRLDAVKTSTPAPPPIPSCFAGYQRTAACTSSTRRRPPGTPFTLEIDAQRRRRMDKDPARSIFRHRLPWLDLLPTCRQRRMDPTSADRDLAQRHRRLHLPQPDHARQPRRPDLRRPRQTRRHRVHRRPHPRPRR